MDLPDCPPGTEGYEEAFAISAKPILDGTKAEREFQSHAHGFKVKLQDGSLRSMLERKKRDPAGQWVYLCYPCGATCRGETMMQNHIIGKKHMIHLENCKVWPLSIFNEHPYYHESAYKKQSAALAEKPYSVLDEISHEPCVLQPVLDEHTSSPLVGLEYLVELETDEANQVAQYHCLLCDTQGKPRTIINHLNSNGHRRRFVERHYCAVHRALGPYRKLALARGTRAVLHTLATRVEQAHGRMRPVRTTRQHFQKHRTDIFKHILGGPHISEKIGESYLEVVDKDLIYFLSNAESDVKKKEPSPPVVAAARPSSGLHSSAGKQSASRSSAQPKVLHHGSTESLSSVTLSSLEASPVLNNRQKRETNPGRPAGDIKRIRPNSQQSEGFDEQLIFQNKLTISKIDRFERAVENLIHDLNKKLSYHEKNPEKHPHYPEEWKKFWNRRYKELQNENKDPGKFDFKPEWIVFWTKRMKELHDEEYQSQKNDACRRLNVPLEAVDANGVIEARVRKGVMRQLRSPERHRFSPRRSPARCYSPRQRSSRGSPVRRSSQRRYTQRRSPERRGCPPRRRSPPLRHYSPGPSHPRYRSSPPLRRSPPSPRATARPDPRNLPHRTDRNHSVPREPSITLISDGEMELNENEDSNLSPWGDSDSLESVESVSARRSTASTVSRRPAGSGAPTIQGTGVVEALGQEDIVSVLRLLSAFENYLSSIGPRIVDLLTLALKMEKNCPNSSDELLLDEAHCVLVDTAKEKLKCAVNAGLVPSIAVTAARDSVSRTAALLHRAEILQQQRAEKEKADKEGVHVASVGAVEKAAIAQQIAAALVEQGKTDVTTEELATLVDALIGMANAKRNALTAIAKPIAQDETCTKLGPTTTPSPSSGSALQMLCSAYNETIRLELQERPSRIEKDDETKDQECLDRPKEMEDKSSMDGLSDSDLKTLLQNFKDLSSDEQHDLIGYLRKLESREPARVERLRQFVNLEPSIAVPVATVPHATAIDSEDDDYTFDEVFKSAALKVKENQMQQEMEVVQKSLQHAHPVEEANKVLTSQLSSLPPLAAPQLLGAVSTTSRVPSSESSLQTLTSAPHLDSYVDRYSSDTPAVHNQFQEGTESYHHQNHQVDQPAPAVGGDYPQRDCAEQVYRNQPVPVHHRNHQCDRPAPAEGRDYPLNEDAEQVFPNQLVPMQLSPAFQEHTEAGTQQWEDGFECTPGERRFVAQEPGTSIHCYDEYASCNSSLRGTYTQDVWGNGPQMRGRGGYNGPQMRGHGGEGPQRHFAPQELGSTPNDRNDEYTPCNSSMPGAYAAEAWGDGPQMRRSGCDDGPQKYGHGGERLQVRGGGGGQRGLRGHGKWNYGR